MAWVLSGHRRVAVVGGSLNIAKWRNRYTRDAQNVVPARACEFDSRLGYWILQVGRRPTSFHEAGVPGSIPGTATCCGWASAHSGLISLNSRVRPPDPLLMAEYANWQSGHVESVAILQVRLLPRSLS